MTAILAGSIILSVFHALIPSHWLPVIAVGKKEGWGSGKILAVTFWAGLAHVLSTLLLGWGLAFAGERLGERYTSFLEWVSPLLLCLLGGYYIFAHYFHRHFHLHERNSSLGMIASLALAMFLSPCLEVEGFFLAAGAYGFYFVLLLSAVYGLVTIAGMLCWVWLVLHGLHRKNWHAWEHNAGIVTGVTLVLSGLAGLLH